MSPEEKTARNHQIIADIACDAAVQKKLFSMTMRR
jgi:hypothetical protein